MKQVCFPDCSQSCSRVDCIIPKAERLKWFMEHARSSWTNLQDQIDPFSCIRCQRITRLAAFVFDDGTFYCAQCWAFMKGGDVNG